MLLMICWQGLKKMTDICNQVLADTLVVDAALADGEDIELDGAVIKVAVSRI